MTELGSSKRGLLQATYAPIKVPSEDHGESLEPMRAHGRAWEKWSFVASLKPSPRELAQLRRRSANALRRPGIDDPSGIKNALKGIEIIKSTMPRQGIRNALRSVKLFRDIEPDTLIRIAEDLIELRRKQVDSVINAHKSIEEAFEKAQSLQKPLKVAEKIPAGWKPVKGLILPHLPGATVYRFEKKETLAPRQPRGRKAEEEVVEGKRRTFAAKAVLPKIKERPLVATPEIRPEINVSTLMNWAIKSGVKSDVVAKTLEISEYLPMRAELGVDSFLKSKSREDFKKVAEEWIDCQEDRSEGFKQRMTIEPVGFLHLERLSFIPAGIERGELVHSLPLAPGEEVNISHKEWSSTSEEYEKIVTDFFEGFSEEGVAEKSEIAVATNSQRQHSSAFNTGVTASGGYGPVQISASVGYNVADSATDSEQFSRNQSISLTRKASSRTKKDHKMSFKVASASGEEDQAVKKIVNPDAANPTRVDYYQLIRKWRVDLYRYGIRLTYDINIPEPGSGILSKILEIKRIDNLLEKEFEFNLNPDSITRENYVSIAAQYNATVEPPLPEPKYLGQTMTHEWPIAAEYRVEEEAAHWGTHVLEFDVDDDYYVSELWFDESGWPQPSHSSSGRKELTTSEGDVLGISGKVHVGYQTFWLQTYSIIVRLTLRLTDDYYRRWRLKVWNAIRDAAQAQYYENRQMLKECKTRLLEELGAQDALSLRKIERDELMKGVLRWLFGPAFEFVPAGMPEDLYASNEAVVDEQIWGRVLSHGEIIKFLHHAIEWDNMLYFLYPYFWSHPNRWELKKYLDHPDSLHKAFLKSGSARTVLPIRPGFERDFMSLLETGDFEALPADHPYLTIADEIETYAKANYPGIPPANPEEADEKEKGKSIGTWYEYTPTSALDIEFGEEMPDA